jgi:hypothetical protein
MWVDAVGAPGLVPLGWCCLLQMVRLNETRLQRYDYGTDCRSIPRPYYESCNQDEYGSMRPPAYNLSRIRAPQVWLQGGEQGGSWGWEGRLGTGTGQ